MEKNTEWIKRFYQDKISTRLVRLLIKMNLSANQVTIINHIWTLTISVYLFSRGTWICYILGVISMMFNVILDYADGDVARETGKGSQVGTWLDTGFDVIIQCAVMGALLLGAYKQGLNAYWIVWFYIATVGSNFVSFHFNNTFGFNSHIGNKVFRSAMEQKENPFNRFMKNIVDPTSSGVGLFVFTYRYWIVLGALFNIMPVMLIVMAVIHNVRWFIMYVLYACHLMEASKLWIFQALAILDKERQEYYKNAV